MHIAALLALAGALQADSGEQYFRFKPGTRWTYRQTQGERTSTSVLTVVKDESGRVTVESREFREEGKAPKVSSIVWVVSEGFLTWEEMKQGKQVLRVYKLGSSKGDAWKSPLGEGRGEMDATHLGAGEVKVPAGIFKEAVQVRMRIAQAEVPFSLDIHLAPRVGPVRMGGTFGDQKMLMELTEFQEGK